MYKIIYPTQDSTIYERFPAKNTGADQIIELQSIKVGQPTNTNDYYPTTYNSRIVINFDISDLSSSFAGKEFESYLILTATEVNEVPINYTIYAYPLSGSWQNGTGFYNNNPDITNGVSWTKKSTSLSWATSSYNVNSTGSWTSNPGGGNWYTTVSASQTFNYQSADMRMNVTPIIKQWLSGSFPNNGLILKYSDNDEQSLDILGNIQFFSKDTHTIYLPKLESFWNDSILTGTGSFSEPNSTDAILYCKNLKDFYTTSDKSIVRIGVRSEYPIQTYATSSNYLIQKRLPVNSYYMIKDVDTDEFVLNYNVLGTKVNCDANGNYIKLDCSSLMPERYYKLMFRTEWGDGSVNYIDQNYIFRITQ